MAGGHALYAAKLAREHPNFHAVLHRVPHHFRRDAKVGRVGHFFAFRKVQPQLKAQHALRRFWHLLMQNAAARRHPLAVAGANHPAVAKAVLVLNAARN
ncbi:hypothetical protein SDC9_172698 [bioreactor metagenome]|uniref:Uncharacterized protein n=1 Tax=bioreactor metagenome TaxID=1076179 RepID=A0A645GEE5_9ZZZZ